MIQDIQNYAFWYLKLFARCLAFVAFVAALVEWNGGLMILALVFLSIGLFISSDAATSTDREIIARQVCEELELGPLPPAAAPTAQQFLDRESEAAKNRE